MTTPGALLGGVDRAAFVAALAGRLREAGIAVSVADMTSFADALEAVPPARTASLYWLARVTLVHREHDLDAFDRVFDAAFGQAVLPLDPHARRHGVAPPPPASDDTLQSVRGAGAGGEETDADLPWRTLPRAEATDDQEVGRALPELLPSAVQRLADTPLDELDEAELAVLGRWLEQSAPRWPTRRSRRQQVRSRGQRVALRATIAASRRTGWEPLRIYRYQPVRRPLTVTLACDVSQSMQRATPRRTST